ncbi:MAG: hypothetical protein OXG51_01160 [Gammaproteobacteria bacterium]|nr:hypothetical protein [Gammaproteobacteria bacterium]
MQFLSFLALLGIAYLLWRLTDQIPDIIFRLSEIQRDTAELLRLSKAKANDADAAAADSED